MNGLDINPRRLGTGLLAFGMTGVILAGLIAVALFGGRSPLATWTNASSPTRSGSRPR